jgi:hypothetical protein
MNHSSDPRPGSIDLSQYAEDGLLRRIRGEFLEMPGLRLTEAQAARLWGMDLTACSELLRCLIDTRFLFRTRDGAVMRVEPGTPLKAGLAPPANRITAA